MVPARVLALPLMPLCVASLAACADPDTACEWQSQDRSLHQSCFNTSVELCGEGAEYVPEHIPLPFPFVVPEYWSYRVFDDDATCEELGYAFACSDESAEVVYYETDASCVDSPAPPKFAEKLAALLEAIGGEGCAADRALTLRCQEGSGPPVGWRCFDDRLEGTCEPLENEPYGFCCPPE